jgi:hypothetical protein
MAFEHLIRSGISPTRIRDSALFYGLAGDDEVKKAFGHRNYGCNKRGVSKEFIEQVEGPTFWFRGNSKLEEAKKPLLRAEHFVSSFPTEERKIIFQHDIAFKEYDAEKNEWRLRNPAETCSKVFVVCSPWQFLHTLGTPTETKKTKAVSLFGKSAIMNPSSPQYNNTWFIEGQPLYGGAWPSCSLYAPRYDNMFPEYFLTIDVDGKVCMTPDEMTERNGARVTMHFEENGVLEQITTMVKTLLGTSFNDMTCHVSWHRSIGWKPSWRAYVVGPIFSNILVAKHFVTTKLIPALREEKWWKEDLVDDRTFQKGFDRCIGSAKLDTEQDMRFLDQHPLEISDNRLKEMFIRCPNEYTLRCLGLILPENYLTTTSEVVLLDSPEVKASAVAVRTAKRPSLTGLSVNDSLVSEIVQKTLKENEFIEEVADWEGSNVSVYRDDLKYVVQIRAVNSSVFCAFKECEKDRNGKLTKSQNSKPHTGSGKQIFKIFATTEKAVLRQSCFNCQKPELQLCALSEDSFEKLKNILFQTETKGSSKKPKIQLDKYTIHF